MPQSNLPAILAFVGIGTSIGFGLVAKALDGALRRQRQENERLEQKARLEREQSATQQAKNEAAIGTLRRTIDQKDFELLGTQLLTKEKFTRFPWLLSANEQLLDAIAIRAANYLENKSHPAKKAAEEVRAFRDRARAAEAKLHLLRYRQEYCEHLFPWLRELSDEDIATLLAIDERRNVPAEESTADSEDPVRKYLSAAEYNSLNESERNQRALDRYVVNRKSSWEIGRDFERLVGYLYEKDGFDIRYHGAIEGFDDLGRDLIAHRGQEIVIVQCKYWAKEKTIHEKHIYQLYGTFCDYVITQNLRPEQAQGEIFSERVALKNVTPVFITTAQLSDRARKTATLLGVSLKESFYADWDYPRIKCNVSQRDGSKIYHLPLDQQYDRVRIEAERSEFYCETCAEAEKRGFRRAWRWKPDAKD